VVASGGLDCHLNSGCGFPAPGAEIFLFDEIANFTIGNLEFGITKVTILLFVCVFLICGFFLYAFRKPKLVPRGAQNVGEMGYLFIRDGIARDTIGKEGDKYVPFLMSFFFLVWLSNFMGIVPFAQIPVPDSEARWSTIARMPGVLRGWQPAPAQFAAVFPAAPCGCAGWHPTHPPEVLAIRQWGPFRTASASFRWHATQRASTVAISPLASPYAWQARQGGRGYATFRWVSVSPPNAALRWELPLPAGVPWHSPMHRDGPGETACGIVRASGWQSEQ
jgi:hypothetical protein